MPSPGGAATFVAYDDLAPSGGSGGVSRPQSARRRASSTWRERRPSEQENSWSAPRKGAPSPLAVARALPEGSARATSQAAWLRAVEEHPAVLGLRQDGRRGLVAVARVLARWADWTTLTTRPTWATLAAETGVVERTVARWLEWLREAGLLGTVEHGSTPAFRPLALRREGDGNRAAVYVLAAPQAAATSPLETPAAAGRGSSSDGLVVVYDGRSGRQDDDGDGEPGTGRVGVPGPVQGLSVIPPGLLPEVVSQYARASVDLDPAPLRGVATTARRPAEQGAAKSPASPGVEWPLRRAPRTRRERFELCVRLQRESPTLRAVGSPRRLRFLLRPVLDVGWTGRGVMHALDFAPTGEPWRFAWGGSDQLRNPAGWVRHRLSLWVALDGRPMADPIVSGAEVATQPRVLRAAAPAVPAAPVASEETRGFYLAQIRARLAARPLTERRVRRPL